MSDQTLQEQIAYYRARAGEYDQWFYRIGQYDHGAESNGRWFDEVEEAMRALHQLGMVDEALELACGKSSPSQVLMRPSKSPKTILSMQPARRRN